ncbi:MAG TPA: hypothetical protein VIZ31_03940, partial [Vicinamibacteria bacterium]
MISNLKSNVLGSYLEVCGKGPGLTLTQFTLDFTVRGGIDVSADALVARIHSSASGDEDVVGQIAVCSSGPCARIRRACITAGRSTTTGTLEVSATEEYRAESSWTLQVRQSG